MTYRILPRFLHLIPLLLLLAFALPAYGEDTLPAEESGPLLSEEDIEGLGADLAEESSLSGSEKLFTGNVYVGQKFISNDEAGFRAFPYTYLRPGLVGGGAISLLDKDYKFDLEGNYLSARDNQGSLAVDIGGHYRFLFLTESMFHNLVADRFYWNQITISNGNPVAYAPPSSAVTNLGITVRQDKVTLRAKPTDYPFHFDLGLKRYSQEGSRQLRFADVRFASPANTVYNRQRPIDQAIDELTAGVDAHLGYIDVVNQFQIRNFKDNLAIPRMVPFNQQQNTVGNTLRNGGFLQHNENPDSRFWANTLRLHSSLSGGLVGALSYTYGQRQSFSKLTDIAGVSSAKVIVHNMASDVTYTPLPEFTLSLKLRRLVTEKEFPSAVVRTPSGGSPAIGSNGEPIGESLTTQVPVELVTNSLISTLIYRPMNWLLLKGEFKGDFVRREGDAEGNSKSWVDSHNEDHYQGKVAIVATPVKGLRIKGQYLYSAITNPLSLYGINYNEKHSGELVASYNRSNAFGTSVSYREVRDYLNSIYSFDRRQRAITTAGWLNPFPMLTLNASFAYLQTATDRTVYYGTSVGAAPGAATYLAQSQIYGINALLHLFEQADISIGYLQVRGSSVFAPAAQSIQITPTILGDTSGIAEISRTHNVEHEVTTRIDYQVTSNIQSSIEYLYRTVHNYMDSSLNGGAHQVMASFGFKW